MNQLQNKIVMPWFKRRRYLSGIGIFSLSFFLLTLSARAKKPEALAAIQEFLGSKPVQEGRVKLIIPPLVESGNLVALKVSVESPMTPSDYVKAVHIIAEGNPLPNILSAYFTTGSGEAKLSTRVRLADSQRVWAIAEMSDGTFWQTYADTKVTLSACTEVI